MLSGRRGVMLNRFRLAMLAAVCALCVLTPVVAAPPGPSGPLAEEPIAELAQRVERRRLDRLPGPRTSCQDGCSRRFVLCMLRTERQLAPGPRQRASRTCRFVYRYCSTSQCP